MESALLFWLHLASFAVYAAATAWLALVALPIALSRPDEQARLRTAVRFLRIYDPLSIAALGVLIMTGAFGLTAYKAVMRDEFFVRVGSALAWKLTLTFLLINAAAYLALGLGHRLVLRAQSDEPGEAGWVDRTLRRALYTSICALALLVAITFAAFNFTRAAARPPATPPASSAGAETRS